MKEMEVKEIDKHTSLIRVPGGYIVRTVVIIDKPGHAPLCEVVQNFVKG